MSQAQPAPKSRNRILAVLTAVCWLALVAATVHVAHQYARTRLALSGDEYFFYYSAAHRYTQDPDDPIFLVQKQLRQTRQKVVELAARNPSCRAATSAAVNDIDELLSLLKGESSAQGYGGATVLQRLSLGLWRATSQWRHGLPSEDAYELGRRIAFTIAFPMVVVVALTLLVAALQGSSLLLPLLGVFVLLHGLVAPAAEAYWTFPDQALSNPLWTVSTAVGLPFLNPRYSDSLFSIAPRGYLVLPFLLALGLRWEGRARRSYAVLAILPLFHPPIGFMIFGLFWAMDFLIQPRILRDPWVLLWSALACAVAVFNGAISQFIGLIAVGGPLLVTCGAAAIVLATIYNLGVARRPAFVRVSEWVSRHQAAADVLAFGPVFLMAWLGLAMLHAMFQIPSAYGLANLAMKSGAIAHYVVVFGLFWVACKRLVRALEVRIGRDKLACSLLAIAFALSLAVFFVGPAVPKNWPSLIEKYGMIAKRYDDLSRREPVVLGNFQTHLIWHRIVRERETGGGWLDDAFALPRGFAPCPEAAGS